MRVIADRGRCVGSGMCVFVAPAVFGQDDRYGLVETAVDHPGEEARAAVLKAVVGCPVAAISVVEEAEGEG